MLIKIRYREVLWGFIFLLLSRTISIYYFNVEGIFNQVYLLLSKIATVIILLLGCVKLYYLKGKKLYLIIIFCLLMLASTIYMNGSIRRCVMLIYPILGMNIFIMLVCSSLDKMKHFIYAIAKLMFVLNCINFIFLIYNRNFFGKRFFLGIENQLGYSLLLGFLFNALDSYYNKNKMQSKVYNLMFFATIFIIGSGSNVVGTLIIIIYLLFFPLKCWMEKRNLNLFLLLYLLIFISVIIFSSSDFLNIPIVKYFIQDILGKNLTLTNRTAIWKVAVSGFREHPFLGHGIRETVNLFYINLSFLTRISVEGTYSAHNQLLQSLYEIGIVGILPIVLLLLKADSNLKECSVQFVRGVFRISIVVCMVMMLAEAPGLNLIIFLANFALIVSNIMNEENKNNKSIVET